MNRKDRTIKEALRHLHVALAEALHSATMTDVLPAQEAEQCFDLLDQISSQLTDLRAFIQRRAK